CCGAPSFASFDCSGVSWNGLRAALDEKDRRTVIDWVRSNTTGGARADHVLGKGRSLSREVRGAGTAPRLSSAIRTIKTNGFLLVAPVAFVIIGCGSDKAQGGADTHAIGTVSQAVTAQPEPSCQYLTFGGHDYWLCSSARNWSDAQARCASVGTALARVDSA